MPVDLDLVSADTAPAGLPAGFVFGERATAAVRAYLTARGLGDWPVYFIIGPDYGDIDEACETLGITAKWEPLPALTRGGAQPTAAIVRGVASDDGLGPVGTIKPARPDERTVQERPSGALWLRDDEAVLARWYVFDEEQLFWRPVHLMAAPSAAKAQRVRQRLLDARRGAEQCVWQVADGTAWGGGTVPRDTTLNLDGLVLDPDVKQRLASEISGFFDPKIAAMYAELAIPYRRGVLLYGPPGNGKTSLVRAVGGMNPQVPALLLRAGEEFNDSALQNVLESWQEQAPALLVIEDLDWLFHQRNLSVSTFLNQLDGVQRRDGGLLLIATTNNPDALDPAINNRPGRFDVSIEVRDPERPLRQAYFARSTLAFLDAPALTKLLDQTDGLSFAHLREIESLAGMVALRAGRSKRTSGDVLAAAEIVARTGEQARNGFAPPSRPFGLKMNRTRSDASFSEDDIPF